MFTVAVILPLLDRALAHLILYPWGNIRLAIPLIYRPILHLLCCSVCVLVTTHYLQNTVGSIGRQGHPELGKLKFPVPARTFRYSGITGGPGEKVHTSSFQRGICGP